MPNENAQVVSLEVAQSEFEKMCVGRRLKTSDDTWTEQEREAFGYIKETICAAICDGRLSIDGDDPVLHPTAAGAGVPARIKFGKAKGTTLLAMDGKTGGAKQFAAYADMSGIGASHFGQLGYWDVELLAKLFTLFFAPR